MYWSFTIKVGYMTLTNKKTGLKVSEDQAIAAVDLIIFLGGAVKRPETKGQALYLYLPEIIVEELDSLIEEILKDNDRNVY